ncbi:hypothetical protein NLG97_g10827 [Lecanicillium saksenae]|uniref:Uncharacterized protein n=1 Tax=Lecanicillium saksenae TaxID=468837 RepID=A0ACC1QFY3_9HYPO|nr:hypothetical protein NLG97_g10827 [Lecanicillium saksenae]
MSKVMFYDDQRAAAVLVAAKANGQLVRALEAEVSAEAGDEMKTPALSAAGAELLGGRWTPNVHTALLNFDFVFEEGYDWSEEGINWFEEADHEENFAEAERTYLWRALVNDVWRAVCVNTAVTTLIIDGFLPVWQSAYKTPEFARFMKQIKHVNPDSAG